MELGPRRRSSGGSLRSKIVGEDLERGTLKRLFKVSLPAPERYWFVSPKETANAPKVKAFRDWVKSELR